MVRTCCLQCTPTASRLQVPLQHRVCHMASVAGFRFNGEACTFVFSINRAFSVFLFFLFFVSARVNTSGNRAREWWQLYYISTSCPPCPIFNCWALLGRQFAVTKLYSSVFRMPFTPYGKIHVKRGTMWQECLEGGCHTFPSQDQKYAQVRLCAPYPTLPICPKPLRSALSFCWRHFTEWVVATLSPVAALVISCWELPNCWAQ